MEFRSGRSFWRTIAPQRQLFPPFQGDARCDVVVIGGGISGVLAAHRLVEAGLDTYLVEKGEIAAESTAASTGLLQYEIDTPLCELVEKVGQASAVQAYRRGLDAIDELEELVTPFGDRVGFSRRESLYFASEPSHLGLLRQEYECRRQLGFDVRYLEREVLADISSIPAAGALQSSGDAQLDPFRFTCALLDAASGRGLTVHEHTCVTAIDHIPGGLRLTAGEGHISAAHVVFAAGYASDRYLKRRVGDAHSTYVVTSEPLNSLAGWPDGCLLWETARPYFYARQTDDGRAMIGGEDTPYHDDHERDGLVECKCELLIARFEKLFPQLPFRPAFAWAGTFAETKDGMAYIGQPPGRDREYFAIGYGGNGITASVIAADLIRDLIVGRANVDAAVFRFGR